MLFVYYGLYDVGNGDSQYRTVYQIGKYTDVEPDTLSRFKYDTVYYTPGSTMSNGNAI